MFHLFQTKDNLPKLSIAYLENLLVIQLNYDFLLIENLN